MSVICRACLEKVDEKDYFYIDTLENVQISNAVSRDVLQLCVPEMDLYISEKPGVCSECLNLFERFYNFKNKCLASEDKILAYLKKHNLGLQSKVNLSSVVDDVPLQIAIEEDEHSPGDDSSVREMVAQNEVTLFSCKRCSFVSTSQPEFGQHKCLSKEKRYKCPQCEYAAYRSFRLKQHIYAKHTKINITSFACSQCNYISMDSSNLRRHRLSNHSISENVLALNCPDCEFRTVSELSLRKHRVATHGPIIHSCDVCSYKTKDKSNFKKHLFVHSGKPIKCTKCSYQCGSPYQLQRHFKNTHI